MRLLWYIAAYLTTKYRQTAHIIYFCNIQYLEPLEMGTLIKSYSIYHKHQIECFISHDLFFALNKLQMAEWITPYRVTSNQDTSWIIYIDNR